MNKAVDLKRNFNCEEHAQMTILSLKDSRRTRSLLRIQYSVIGCLFTQEITMFIYSQMPAIAGFVEMPE
jgi:hypothetical protein